MVGQIYPALMVLIGVVVTGAVAWVADWRKTTLETRKAEIERERTSGTVQTTDAGVLWSASESIRHDMFELLAACRADMAALRTEMRDQDQKWRAEVDRLEAEINELQRQMNGA